MDWTTREGFARGQEWGKKDSLMWIMYAKGLLQALPEEANITQKDTHYSCSYLNLLGFTLLFLILVPPSFSLETSFFFGETTLLVLEIYMMCTIDPLSFNWVLLVPQVSKLNAINPLLTADNIIIDVANRIMTWHFLKEFIFIFKK